MTQHSLDRAPMMMAGLNLIQQALSIYDSDLRLVICNRMFREMFNLPGALTTPGARFEDTIRHLVERGEYGPFDDPDQAVHSRVEQARAFEPHYMERTRPDGRVISVEGAPLPEGGWITVYTDITQTKNQEALLRARSEELSDKLLAHAEELSATNRKLASTIAALEEAKRQLTETEARTRLTTEMMPAHIAHVGLNRTYTFSNLRLSSILPGRPAHIVGLPIAEALGDEAYGHIHKNLDAAFEGQPSVMEFTHEGSSRRIRTAFTPDLRQDGQIMGVYLLSTDITEETQARTALQQTRRRELAAQLTSGLAHDFSNLLTIIMGSQSRLQRMDLPAGAAELVAATLGATHRGGSLLNRLADITGAREWRPQPTSLAPLLHDLEMLAAPALPQGIRLDVFNMLENDRLMLDPGMIQDALLNLFLNARDAIGDNGGITLSVTPVQNTWADFTVTDTGPGFDQVALDHAFQPFFSTKGGEGSGLGLAMVYDTAKLAGGQVQLSNRTEGGARVRLRLPLRPAPPPVAPGLVLLVEDSTDLRAGIRAMLTDQSHTVIEATSADEALGLLREVPDIRLILSDISLEGVKTGLDLAAALPDDAPPCILMTSLPPEHPLHVQALTRAPVLRKPFSARELGAFLSTRGAQS
ncbi:PAS-domain containing protein [Lutimaribacter sp. EGI FJ00015]|uniref:PAS-domain containing protein n=1 Tax=Lutimaribacter degradans TaxID=2945989 RepID=A0ACC5ZY39_9RHOB|nr:PAS-domain containing protein [Lutimaribacter sp. EGI FJ00013]MCM2562745.1 PAS-domain containing protein [Lutimaribacter sp. EGI FJ00013]MCO0613902.1 PAS-domain containing protein [Lutimaribacter sp. EGI FJ00015]MCO0636874.1 PAS-domain containing protein [Lutimaribacter sp. EGI FJ00014]